MQHEDPNYSFRFPWKAIHVWFVYLFGDQKNIPVPLDELYHMIDDDDREDEEKLARTLNFMKRGWGDTTFSLYHMHFFIRESTWFNYPMRLLRDGIRYNPMVTLSADSAMNAISTGVGETRHIEKRNLLEDSVSGHQHTCNHRYRTEFCNQCFQDKAGKNMFPLYMKHSHISMASCKQSSNACDFHWLPLDYFSGEEVHMQRGEIRTSIAQLQNVVHIFHEQVVRMLKMDTIDMLLGLSPYDRYYEKIVSETMGFTGSTSNFAISMIKSLQSNASETRGSAKDVFMCDIDVKYNTVGMMKTPGVIHASFCHYTDEIVFSLYRDNMKEEEGYVVMHGIPKNNIISLVDPRYTKLVPLCECRDDGYITKFIERRDRTGIDARQMYHLVESSNTHATMSASISPYLDIPPPTTSVKFPVKTLRTSSCAASSMRYTDEADTFPEMIPGVPYSKYTWDSFADYYDYYVTKHPWFLLNRSRPTPTPLPHVLQTPPRSKNIFQSFLFSIFEENEDFVEEDEYAGEDYVKNKAKMVKDKVTGKVYYAPSDNTAIPNSSDVDQYVVIEDLVIKDIEFPLNYCGGVLCMTFCTINDITDLRNMHQVVLKYTESQGHRDTMLASIAALARDCKILEEAYTNAAPESKEHKNMSTLIRGMALNVSPLLLILSVTIKFPALLFPLVKNDMEQ